MLLALLQTPTPAADPAVTIDLHVRAGRYLAALDGAERLALESENELVLDQLGLVQSFAGQEEETLVTFDRLNGERAAPAGSSPVDGATALDAIPALVEAAKGRRIVVLNESHHYARHRAFALELARALRAEGFDTFAAETFADAAGLEQRGWPDASTGYYTAEPVFGELVRGAAALGYRLVEYEWKPTGPPSGDVGAQIRVRETAQAKNLHERVFQAHPDARLLVYVGYSHATEDWSDAGGPNERAWMAARLAKLTGFDPLTIDQTECVPRSEATFENAHWRRAEERGLLDGPKLLRPASGDGFVVVGTYAGKVDAQVFHPRTPPFHGRPGWLARGRSALQVPAEIAAKIPGDERVLLQAFHEGEGAGAIPADQFTVEPGALSPWFLLARGTYRLAVQKADGKTLATLDAVRVD